MDTSKLTPEEVNVLLSSILKDITPPSTEEWQKLVQSCIEKLPLKIKNIKNVPVSLPTTSSPIDKIDISSLSKSVEYQAEIGKFPTFSFGKSWEYQDKIPGTPYHLCGHSRAAERTGMYVPELKLMLDAGLSSNFSPRIVAITHCHADHCCQIPMVLMNWQAKDETHKIPVVIPYQSMNHLDDMIGNEYRLFYQGWDAPKTYQVVGGKDKLEMPIPDLKNMFLRMYQCYHSAPCLGYGVVEKRKKLKPEYRSLPQDKIKELAKAKVELSCWELHHHFVFLGDTDIRVFQDPKSELFLYSSIIVECSFLLEGEEELATKKTHIHWNHLRPVIEAHPEIHFILIHFSLRYKAEEIQDFFHPIKESGLTNFTPWLA